MHEWGSFICLQDEKGRAIGGINTDAEPLPDFVYDATTGSQLLFGEQSKDVARCHPDITMRIEPRFICFYPPDDFYSRVDVSVLLIRGLADPVFSKCKSQREGQGSRWIRRFAFFCQRQY